MQQVDTDRMRQRITTALRNDDTFAKVVRDFRNTFMQLGLSYEQASNLFIIVFHHLAYYDLPKLEADCLALFGRTIGAVDGKPLGIIDVLDWQLRSRAQLIFNQVRPFFAGIPGKIIDFGCGDGRVTQLIHDQINRETIGCDVRRYPAYGVRVPIEVFGGYHLNVADGAFEAGLLTNVLHHESDNEQILNELDRIVTRRLVVIETVPIGETEEEMEWDKDRTFMCDYLYNRLFHNADVPVPGTFETPEGWRRRFQHHGWRPIEEVDLGVDQPIIRDRHYLFVFERA